MGYKILGISSGRPMGNAEVILREALIECEALAECEVKITRLRGLKIEEFTGDYSFLEEAANGGDGFDGIEDDLIWLKEQILWADAIIFSTPDFTYMPTSEMIKLLNRGLGVGQAYKDQCRQNPKKVGLIGVGGSDTVDFHMPLLHKTVEAICPGFELADEMFCNWIRGKGYIVFQDYHTERARLLAKRLINSLKGYKVPEIQMRIMKLNPMEYKDNEYIYMAQCPVCHSSVVQMHSIAPATGTFQCTCCGARGHVEAYGQQLVYEWDDDSIAHNRLDPEYDRKNIELYVRAHKQPEGEKAAVRDFPHVTPANDISCDKPYILGVVAGPEGGTSELLARKALEEATRDGSYEGFLVNVLDLKIDCCTGCLLCKVNARYRGGIDECVLKDDDHWLIEKFLDSAGVILSVDGVNGMTYSRLVSFWQRFGHFALTMGRGPRRPSPFAVFVSSYDDQVGNALFGTNFVTNFFCKQGPYVEEEVFPFVPVMGDGILADKAALGRAGMAGMFVRNAADLIGQNPAFTGLVRTVEGVCPSCKCNLIELHKDMTASCALCDAKAKFERRFGKNDLVWDEYSVTHSRRSFYGVLLHAEHIDYSQKEDRDVLDNPKIINDALEKYISYGKLVKPER